MVEYTKFNAQQQAIEAQVFSNSQYEKLSKQFNTLKVA
jgi:hypothetical protein